MDFLQPLRAEYLTGTDDRLGRLTGALDRLRRDPADAAALTDLRMAFHRLVGSAATFGVASISEVAVVAERGCAAFDGGGIPDRSAIAGWQEAADRIRTLFDAARAGVPAADRPAEHEPARADARLILSVEDDPDYAAYLRALLGEAGYLVQICTEPAHFEQELAEFRPDPSCSISCCPA